MKVTSFVRFTVSSFALVSLAGCTDAGAIAFRKASPTKVEVALAEPSVKPVAAEEAKHAETVPLKRTETLIATASARMPPRPSLVTLAPGEDLMAKVNSARGAVLIDFYADWCGPCQVQGRILRELENEAASLGALMIKVNIDDHPEIAQRFQVEGIPTLLSVKDGRVVGRKSGVADKRLLTNWMRSSSDVN
ncbi:thioredoxin family protein [Rhodopirellula sp. P2]|uniref:thioredoxin family protein n=1 Tax=Rhodopirellula sp. P2 TaxID=2127060 RepID=UPI002368EB27|nr:thioredoxin family protein [Rhodopirellula sp. P2]WDQ17165.1 thioredoxin family protein [Rhodopirellula sp. P2]